MDINKIYNEIEISHKMFIEGLQKINEPNYVRYNSNQNNWYTSINSKIMQVVGIPGGTKEEVQSQLSSIASTPLTDEQKRQLSEIRKHPMYKKMMGENALQMKAELEQVLGSKITPEGITIVSENGGSVSVKDEATLWEELDNHTEKLSELVSSGQITQQQAQSYENALDSIYTYYVSQSKGEQIPFRKISDSEYEKIEEEAMYKGISPEEQLMEINQDLMYEFQEIQEAALSTQQSGKSL